MIQQVPSSPKKASRFNCTWRDKYGVSHSISAMEDMYLFNVVACQIRDQAFWRQARPALRAIKKEMTRRGIPIPVLQDLNRQLPSQ